jgi:hypothetical protein
VASCLINFSSQDGTVFMAKMQEGEGYKPVTIFPQNKAA